MEAFITGIFYKEITLALQQEPQKNLLQLVIGCSSEHLVLPFLYLVGLYFCE